MILETATGPIAVERSGTGPDLILLHSLLTDRHVYDLVLPDLLSNHRVTLVDLPGYGDTAPAESNIESYADRIGGLLQAGEYDPATTAIMGNGLGGFVALGTAVKYGDRFNKLVLVGCGSSLPPAGQAAFPIMIEKVANGGMEAVIELAVARIFTADFMEANQEMVEERRRVLRQTDPQAFMTACQAIHDVDFDDAMASTTNPTLLVIGSDDLATPPALSQALHASMPNTTYIELPGIAHGPQLQDPEGFMAAVGPFLAA